MALIINTNVNSLKGMSSIRKSSSRLSKTLEHISSGIRVNKAADDAGRLGSITLAESQVRGLQKSIQNLNDGMSLAQTLEGSLGQLEIILQRIRELAVQSSNDTYQAADRQAMNEEAKQLLNQVDKIVEQTNFNNIKLLDGSADSIGIFVDDGVRTNSFDLKLHDVRETSVGRKAQYDSQRRGVHVSDLQTGDMTINGFQVRATDDSDDKVSVSFGSGSAIAKARAINAISELTGVTARAGETVVIANRQIGAFTLDQFQNFAINGVKIAGFEITNFDSDGALRQAINDHHEETGVVASLTSQGELQLIAQDGRNIQIAYSHKNVLEAVGLADTTLDPNNLAGDVILGAPDRDLKGTIQTITTTGGFNAGLIEVGGRFDGSEAPTFSYVDFVGHVVTSGGVGTAQIVWERDPAGDPGPAEDFAFIEGHVINAPDTTTNVNGSFFTDGGGIVAGGSYNEGLNRDYILTVTQAGSTDGPDPTKRAEVSVSTAQDGVIIPNLVLDAGAGPQLIAGATTGEHVFVDIDPSTRSEDFLEGGSAQEYDGTLGNGVTISGSYTGDVSKDFRVRVIDEGYTQGANQAKVEVTERNRVTNTVTTLGSFVVSAGAPITIGDGLSITFAAESPTFGTFTDNSVGTYAGTATVNSTSANFVGERGDGTYGIRITNNGPTGLAQYVTTFNGTDITTAQTLEAGTNVLADGLTFNFDASVSNIGPTNINAVGSDYANLGAVQIGGAYDGQLKDIDVVVSVVQEGRVIAAGEPVTNDAALLRYSYDGGTTFIGSTITAVADQNLTLSNGLHIRFTGNSAISELQTIGGVSEGNNIQFASGTVANYEGTIDIDLDETQLQLSTDARIAVEVPANALVGTGVAGSGNILIHVTDGGGTTTTTLSNVQSGASNTVLPGIDITFTNDAETIEKTTNTVGGLDGQGDGAPVDMNADNTYNGALGNTTLDIQFTGNTSVAAPVVTNQGTGNDGVTATTTGVYNGNSDDTQFVLTFDGTSTNLTPNVGNNDAGQMVVAGNYSGADGDMDLNVTYNASTSENVVRTVNGGGSFDVRATGSFSRLTQNEQLIVTFDEATSVAQVGNTAVSTATVAFNAGAFVWDAGNHAIQVEFVGDDEVKVHVDGAFSSATISGAGLANIDLGTAVGLAAFGGVDPNLGLTVTVDAVADETGETFDLQMNQLQTASILRQGGGAVTGITLTGATTTFNLSDANFVAGLGLDMGVSLDIDQASVGNSDDFTVDLAAVQEATLTDNGTGTAVNFTLANNVNLNNAIFNSIFTSGNPNLSLNFSDPFQSIDDSYDIQLRMAKTGTLTQDGNNLGSVNITTGSVALTGSGVTLNLNNETLAIDDQISVDLTMDKTVTLRRDGALVGGTHDVSTGTLDLGAALGTNVGFDISVNNAVKGRDDAFEFVLTRDHTVEAIANTALTDIEQKTILTNQTFSSDVDAGSLELGSNYTLEVDAPTLEVGKEYIVEERVGTLNAGDQIVVSAIHDFANGPTTLNTTTQLSNGLTLEIDPAANFNIGDEVRFQALQYKGKPNCSGPYDDPAFPTTFIVEVIQSGAVDGGAQVQYTRADNGNTGIVAASSVDTLLQNNVHVSFTAGTLYQGDRFFIETVSDLVQDFGGELILESNRGIEIELASVTIDNELGRLLYIGDPALAQAAGTFDSLTSAFLGVNSEQTISEINLTTQNGAEDALRILDVAIDEVSSHRSDTGAMQNRIERQINSLSEALFQTETYVSRIRDADIAAESAVLAKEQLIQQAGVQILAQMNINPQIALQLVESL